MVNNALPLKPCAQKPQQKGPKEPHSLYMLEITNTIKNEVSWLGGRIGKIIYHSAKLKCSCQKAFEMFTVSECLQKWLTQQADVQPRVGGKYELFWNPKNREDDSTIGCKVLAISESKFVCFEWKGPARFKQFMNIAKPLTCVTVFFIPCEEDCEVHLLHTGWRDTDDWGQARQWFDEQWKTALTQLQKCINS